jgi:hypothetical protein
MVSLWHAMTSLHRVITQLSSDNIIMRSDEPTTKKKQLKCPVINYIETNIYTNKKKSLASSQAKKNHP